MGLSTSPQTPDPPYECQFWSSYPTLELGHLTGSAHDQSSGLTAVIIVRVAICRAPVRIENLLLDNYSASESDTEIYDEALDIAFVASSLFSAISDNEVSDYNLSDAT